MSEGTPLEASLIPAPERGVWRLGKAENPRKYNKISREDDSRSGGNRWSLVSYGTLYCASDLDGCFAEALAPFRVDPELREFIGDDWNEPYFMRPGHLPQDWRTRHTLVRLQPAKEARFLDVDESRRCARCRENSGRVGAVPPHRPDRRSHPGHEPQGDPPDRRLGDRAARPATGSADPRDRLPLPLRDAPVLGHLQRCRSGRGGEAADLAGDGGTAESRRRVRTHHPLTPRRHTRHPPLASTLNPPPTRVVRTEENLSHHLTPSGNRTGRSRTSAPQPRFSGLILTGLQAAEVSAKTVELEVDSG